jgi:antitoxin PrlF
MQAKATLTGKGQITVPIDIRRQMGLREGDQIEFILENGTTIMKRYTADPNPFEKWAGKLGGMTSLEEAIAWQNDLRDES